MFRIEREALSLAGRALIFVIRRTFQFMFFVRRTTLKKIPLMSESDLPSHGPRSEELESFAGPRAIRVSAPGGAWRRQLELATGSESSGFLPVPPTMSHVTYDVVRLARTTSYVRRTTSC